MMSLQYISQMSDEAAVKAAEQELEPLALWPSDCDPPFRFPDIGSMDPEGFEKVEDLFVDHSGFGSPGEAALTSEEFSEKLLAMVKASEVTLFAAITETGQFQLYVTVYRKEGA